MLTPYVKFNGRCAEALAFYKTVFQSEVENQMPYGNYVPDELVSPPENLCDWVLHAEMAICGTKIAFSDETTPMPSTNQISLMLSVPTKAEAERLFEEMKAGGSVLMPPTETFYTAFHADVVDKFGVHWNVMTDEMIIKTS